MKNIITLILVLTFAVGVFAQSDAKIDQIRGRYRLDWKIREAFDAIATDTKTVSAAWTFSGNNTYSGTSTFTGAMTISGTLTSTDTLFLDVAAVSDSLFADSAVVNYLWFGNGSALSNPHADTLSLDETVVNIGGALTIGTDPGGDGGVTAIDTVKAGRWATFTIAGVTYAAIALADTADIVD